MNKHTKGKTVSPSFPIVGLGASAGGLEALEQFFESTPVDTGMAFVVVMHLSDKHKSLLPELLAKSTSLRMVVIEDQMKAERKRRVINK